jgi:hypothetical protein
MAQKSVKTLNKKQITKKRKFCYNIRILHKLIYQELMGRILSNRKGPSGGVNFCYE